MVHHNQQDTSRDNWQTVTISNFDGDGNKSFNDGSPLKKPDYNLKKMNTKESRVSHQLRDEIIEEVEEDDQDEGDINDFSDEKPFFTQRYGKKNKNRAPKAQNELTKLVGERKSYGSKNY
jgi:hypothetical protein